MDQELLAHLLSAAISLSGLPAISIRDLPPILRLPHADIAREVCPGDAANCRGMAALFDSDRYRILVDETLNVQQAVDNSFIVHEFVHVLQFKQRGDDLFANCEESMKAETQAYRVQNAYLKREGQFPRFGHWLAFIRCTGTQSVFFSH